MSDEPGAANDPLNLAAVDQAIRINELTERVRDLGDGGDAMYVSEDCPPGVHEGFLRNIIAWETGPFTSHFEMLQEDGIELPSPDALGDGALTAKLWEVIHALARRSTYLHRTDHLSDRELYEELWSETLHEQTLAEPGSGWECSIDLIGSGSEEDIQTGLRYYESEEERRHWAEEFPGDIIPPHEDPPYDRDRHLPRSPGPEGMDGE